jgi:hypothetical protein
VTGMDASARVRLFDINAGLLEPLLELGPGARDELVDQALQQRTSLTELSHRLDLARAKSVEDEMRELCRAFTTGTCDVIRERRIRLAARVAGCEGIELSEVAIISQRCRLPEATIRSDVDRVFRRIAQAALLGLIPSTPHIDRAAAQSTETGTDLHELAIRFATQVLLRPRPSTAEVVH